MAVNNGTYIGTYKHNIMIYNINNIIMRELDSISHAVTIVTTSNNVIIEGASFDFYE